MIWVNLVYELTKKSLPLLEGPNILYTQNNQKPSGPECFFMRFVCLNALFTMAKSKTGLLLNQKKLF
jgi:hypothetical protein